MKFSHILTLPVLASAVASVSAFAPHAIILCGSSFVVFDCITIQLEIVLLGHEGLSQTKRRKHGQLPRL
jgi:hypothetical protein